MRNKFFIATAVVLTVAITFAAASRLNVFLHPALGEGSTLMADKERTIRQLECEVAGLKLLAEMDEKIRAYYLEGDKIRPDDLYVAAAKGMAGSLDEHSAFQTKLEYERELAEPLRGSFAGIGAHVSMIGRYFTIIRPIYSGPAYAAGLRSRDQIIAVDGVLIVGEPLEDSVNRLRGEPGTKVKVKVMRRTWTEPREMEITRAIVKIENVRYEMLPGSIGLIQLLTFGDRTADEMQEALQALEEEGMAGLIIDVRHNGGGRLDTVLRIVDKFLPKGKLIVYSEGRKDGPHPREEYRTIHETDHPNWPIVILADGLSASASEILAGSLQDHKRATIVGTTTFGKGSIQQVVKMESLEGARLRITTAKYFLPLGRSIHKVGVEPDIKVAEAEDADDLWVLQQIENLYDSGAFDDYVKQYYTDEHKALFARLADHDGKDSSRYPGFDAWYDALKTKAAKETVRRHLQARLRRQISDERKREFFYNLQEDLPLQRGILTILKQLQSDPAAVPQYKFFAEPALPPAGTQPAQ